MEEVTGKAISQGAKISHQLTTQGIESPVKRTELSNDEKIKRVTYHMSKVLETLDMDLDDESIKDTPLRVAKMYVLELFKGLNPENFPATTTFALKEQSEVYQKNIPFTSMCEHHLMPFHGVAHITYTCKDRVLGLSKLNRIVDYFAKRPQV